MDDTKDCSSKFRSKHGTVLVLFLLRKLLEQSLEHWIFNRAAPGLDNPVTK